MDEYIFLTGKFTHCRVLYDIDIEQDLAKIHAAIKKLFKKGVI